MYIYYSIYTYTHFSFCWYCATNCSPLSLPKKDPQWATSMNNDGSLFIFLDLRSSTYPPSLSSSAWGLAPHLCISHTIPGGFVDILSPTRCHTIPMLRSGDYTGLPVIVSQEPQISCPTVWDACSCKTYLSPLLFLKDVSFLKVCTCPFVLLHVVVPHLFPSLPY